MSSEPTLPARLSRLKPHTRLGADRRTRAEHVRPREARRAQVAGRPAHACREPEPQGSGGSGEVELELALKAHPQVVKSVGLYNVVGEAVQAVVGGIYH